MDIKEVIAVEEEVAVEMVAAEMVIGVALTLGNDCTNLLNLLVYLGSHCVIKLDCLLASLLEVCFEVVYPRNCLYI